MSSDSDFHTPESLVERLTEKGRVISISFEIVDSDKALKLLRTFNGVGIDEAGIRVTRWGLYDTASVQEQKLKDIQEHAKRFLAVIDGIVESKPDEDDLMSSNYQSNAILDADLNAFVAKMKRGEA